MFSIMDAVKHRGGDWDDYLADQVSALPTIDQLPGILPEELAIIEEAYSCPRMASDKLSELYSEIEGLQKPEEEEEDSLDRDIQEQIDKLEAVVEALKKIKSYKGTLKEKYWGSEAFDDLDKLGSDVKHSEETIEWEDDHYVDYTSEDPARHKGIMMEYDLLKIDIQIRIEDY